MTMNRKEITNSQDYKAQGIALDWWRRNCYDIRDGVVDIIDAYSDGVIYGWNNPNWISVEDELPEKHFVDTSSKWVLVSIKGNVFIDSYNHKHKEWVNNGKRVTHWMQLPQPPRKEE